MLVDKEKLMTFKVPVSVSSCSDDGRLFHALGPAQENERRMNDIYL